MRRLKPIVAILGLLLFSVTSSYPQTNDQRARELYLQAQNAYFQGEFTTSAQLLENVLRILGTNNLRVSALGVRVYQELGMEAQARSFLDFYFANARDNDPAWETMTTLRANYARIDQERANQRAREDENAWVQATRTNTPRAYFDYRSQYPQGRYIQVANQRLTSFEQQFAESFLQQPSFDTFNNYFSHYSSGPNTRRIQEKLIELADLAITQGDGIGLTWVTRAADTEKLPNLDPTMVESWRTQAEILGFFGDFQADSIPGRQDRRLGENRYVKANGGEPLPNPTNQPVIIYNSTQLEVAERRQQLLRFILRYGILEDRPDYFDHISGIDIQPGRIYADVWSKYFEALIESDQIRANALNMLISNDNRPYRSEEDALVRALNAITLLDPELGFDQYRPQLETKLRQLRSRRARYQHGVGFGLGVSLNTVPQGASIIRLDSGVADPGGYTRGDITTPAMGIRTWLLTPQLGLHFGFDFFMSELGRDYVEINRFSTVPNSYRISKGYPASSTSFNFNDYFSRRQETPLLTEPKFRGLLGFELPLFAGFAIGPLIALDIMDTYQYQTIVDKQTNEDVISGWTTSNMIVGFLAGMSARIWPRFGKAAPFSLGFEVMYPFDRPGEWTFGGSFNVNFLFPD